MDLERNIRVIEAATAELVEQLARPRDLLHVHRVIAAHATYQVLLGVLTPVRYLTEPEVDLQRAYLAGMAGTCEKVASLLHQVEEGRSYMTLASSLYMAYMAKRRPLR
jgi:hypothetical protein